MQRHRACNGHGKLAAAASGDQEALIRAITERVMAALVKRPNEAKPQARKPITVEPTSTIPDESTSVPFPRPSPLDP